MDAGQALADLTEISSQIGAAVVIDGDGAVLGSTFADDERAAVFAAAAARLLEAAGDDVVQLVAAMPDGSVFAVRDDGRAIAATTGADPTVGLVFYDLKSCLRSVDPPSPKPKSRRGVRRKAADAEA